MEDKNYWVNSQTVVEEQVEFVDEEFFGDDKPHYYNCWCKDGEAHGTLCNVDYDISAPEYITVRYPRKDEVIQNRDMLLKIVKYRGLDKTFADVHYGDIMVVFGKIVKN